MENINTNMLIAAVVGFVIGVLVVWVISLSRGGKNSKEYGALKKEYDDYRKKVNAHFAKTADAVDILTKSYKDVFTHLSEGAQSLMDKDELKAQIEKRKDKSVTLAYLSQEADQVKKAAAGAAKEVKQEIKTQVDKAQEVAKEVKEKVTDTAEQVKQSGEDAIDSIKKHIHDAKTEIKK